jgi:SanA protein
MIRKTVLALLGITAAALLVSILMRSAVAPYTYTSIYDVPPAEAAVVLGASVIHGMPSPVLAARADVAIALYRLGKVKVILVTGDNGALTHDEVTPVRKYLLAAGVKPEHIFLDHAGFDTYSSLYRADSVFDARSVIIATQDFHLPRALWTARHLGLDAYGIVAAGAENSPYVYLREILASFKAVWDVLTRRVPKYVGDPIPLSGDGETTWY